MTLERAASAVGGEDDDGDGGVSFAQDRSDYIRLKGSFCYCHRRPPCGRQSLGERN